MKQVHCEYLDSDTRFLVVPAGRRSYKTEIGKRKLVLKSLLCTRPDSWFVAAAPTRDQAKRIFWNDLKEMVPREFVIGRPSDGELVIHLINGCHVSVMGMDRPERIEGIMLGGMLLDEYGNMREETWPNHIRPALSDPSLNELKPFCWFIGVPEGRNHYYDLYVDAKGDPTGSWQVYEWKSAEVIDPEEIEAARRELDEDTFQQEYEGSFVATRGAVYYAFRSEKQAMVALEYDKRAPLVVCWDFNIQHGSIVLCQERPHRDAGMRKDGKTETHVIESIQKENDAYTEKMCEILISKYGAHEGPVHLYGDPAGGNRSTAGMSTVGPDWSIIERMLRPVFGGMLRNFVRRSAPKVRARVNSMNSRLCSMDGVISMHVDPGRAKHIVKDFEGVVWDENGIDIKKDNGSPLTHPSDALGYYIEEAFSIHRAPACVVSRY